MHIKKGDTVTILAGDDKGKTAKVIEAFPKIGKVLVDGVNVMKRHQRARREGEKGQTVERAMPISASKVKLAGEVAPAVKKTSGKKITAAKSVAKK